VPGGEDSARLDAAPVLKIAMKTTVLRYLERESVKQLANLGIEITLVASVSVVFLDDVIPASQSKS
jgi:hypothetical protein